MYYNVENYYTVYTELTMEVANKFISSMYLKFFLSIKQYLILNKV